MQAEDTKERLRILRVIANMGCSILQSYTDDAWIYEDDFETVYVCTMQTIFSPPFILWAALLKTVQADDAFPPFPFFMPHLSGNGLKARRTVNCCGNKELVDAV